MSLENIHPRYRMPHTDSPRIPVGAPSCAKKIRFFEMSGFKILRKE